MPIADLKDASTTLRENERKWGKELLAPGWTLVPNVLLTKQHALSLDPVDVNILLQILKHWWRADESPFPSQGALAATMNIDRSTVKRHLSKLRDIGLISWTSHRRPDGGNASNRYDFGGLIAKAKPFAIEEVKQRRLAAEQRKMQKGRKRVAGSTPDLHVIAGTKESK